MADRHREQDRAPFAGELDQGLDHAPDRGLGPVGGLELAHVEVAGSGVDAVEVEVEADPAGLDPGQPAFSDGVGQLVAIGDRLEHVAEGLAIEPIGRCRDPEDPGRRESVQDRPVADRSCVVPLVDDDQAEGLLSKPGEPGAAKGLDAGQDDRLAGCSGLSLLEARLDADRAQLAGRLLEELAAVGQDQDPATLLDRAAGDLGEDDGLAGPGREDQEGRAVASRVGAADRLDGVGLVGAERRSLSVSGRVWTH